MAIYCSDVIMEVPLERWNGGQHGGANSDTDFGTNKSRIIKFCCCALEFIKLKKSISFEQTNKELNYIWAEINSKSTKQKKNAYKFVWNICYFVFLTCTLFH